MANDIITNLHPDNDPNTNLYPNIKKENIPSKSISTDKLDDNVLSLIGSLKPSGTDTSTNILAYTSNKGIYVATDNGHWYYWNGSAYADGGVYQAISVAENSINYFEIGNDFKQIKDDIKTYLEKLDSLDDIHFPNITTEIEKEFGEFIIYFEFVSFNIYDANHQHIITNENMEMLTVVPEFLHIDTDDYNGLPYINIRVVD